MTTGLVRNKIVWISSKEGRLMKTYQKIVSMVLLLGIALTFTGCPAIPDYEEQKNGKSIREYCKRYCEQHYGIVLKAENTPTAKLSYTINGKIKTASFQLDGYDSEQKIGFKFVTLSDIENWDQKREKGDAEAPDIQDAALLERSALAYEYPIIFIWMEEYWKTNSNPLNKKLEEVFGSDILQAYLKDYMASGEMYKRISEAYFAFNDNISFNPTTERVSVQYEKDGVKKAATFLPDGYDGKNNVGYKFVTRADIQQWAEQRDQGVPNTPDMGDYTLIKEAAMDQDYPIFFIYLEDSWKQNESSKLLSEISKFFSDPRIKPKLSTTYIEYY
jgi:hypothetical protein